MELMETSKYKERLTVLSLPLQ